MVSWTDDFQFETGPIECLATFADAKSLRHFNGKF